MRKEVNVFNISFLDLMSGAFAAVIILFVIVPKSDIQIEESDRSIEEMKTGFREIDSIIQSMSARMSEEEMAVFLSRTSAAEEELRSLENTTRALKERLEETKRQNVSLELKLSLAERKLKVQESSKPAAARRDAARTPAPATTDVKPAATASTPASAARDSNSAASQQSESTARVQGKGDFLFGLNPAFVALVTWDDAKADVDIYLKKENRFCDGQNRSTSFGKWIKMPRKFMITPNEAIIQPEIVPGTYEVYAHLYKPRNSSTTISGFVAISPKDGEPRKIDFGQINLSSSPPPYRSGGGTLIGTVTLTENDMQFKRNH